MWWAYRDASWIMTHDTNGYDLIMMIQKLLILPVLLENDYTTAVLVVLLRIFSLYQLVQLRRCRTMEAEDVLLGAIFSLRWMDGLNLLKLLQNNIDCQNWIFCLEDIIFFLSICICVCIFNGLPCPKLCFVFWSNQRFFQRFFLVIRQHAPSCPQVLVLTPDNNPTVPPSADVASICRALGYQHRIAPRCLGWVVRVWRWWVFLRIFLGWQRVGDDTVPPRN